MKRLITGIGLLAVAFFLIFIAPQPVFIAAAIGMSLLCYREYSGLVAAHNIPRPGIAGVLAGIAIVFWPQIAVRGISPLALLTLSVIAAFLVFLRGSQLSQILPQTACTALGALYTFAPWRFAIDLRNDSVHLLFFALALNWAGDTAAYYVGKTLGRHRLAPVVSPKKSWEGAAGSIAGAVLFGVLYLGHFLPMLPWWQVVVMAVLGNIAGQLGDLVESGVKRGAGVKDSGDLLPGHGGMLDRVDSSLFTLPVVFTLYRVLLT